MILQYEIIGHPINIKKTVDRSTNALSHQGPTKMGQPPHGGGVGEQFRNFHKLFRRWLSLLVKDKWNRPAQGAAGFFNNSVLVKFRPQSSESCYMTI